jgi:hypothetical protein
MPHRNAELQLLSVRHSHTNLKELHPFHVTMHSIMRPRLRVWTILFALKTVSGDTSIFTKSSSLNCTPTGRSLESETIQTVEAFDS